MIVRKLVFPSWHPPLTGRSICRLQNVKTETILFWCSKAKKHFNIVLKAFQYGPENNNLKFLFQYISRQLVSLLIQHLASVTEVNICVQFSCDNPTSLFTVVEPQDQQIGEFYVVQERSPKLWKDRSWRKNKQGEAKWQEKDLTLWPILSLEIHGFTNFLLHLKDWWGSKIVKHSVGQRGSDPHTHLFKLPDQPFHNLPASKCVVTRNIWSTKT